MYNSPQWVNTGFQVILANTGSYLFELNEGNLCYQLNFKENSQNSAIIERDNRK